MGAGAKGSSRGAGSDAECPVMLVGRTGLAPRLERAFLGRPRAAGAAVGMAQPRLGTAMPLVMAVGLPEPCHPPIEGTGGAWRDMRTTLSSETGSLWF